MLEALAHSDVPFEKLVEELRPERLLGNGPFFQVFFQLRNFPEREAEFPGLSASPFVVDPGVTPFDLALELWETRAGLGCSLDYSLDLFERQTASRLVDRYRTLLEAVVADPDRPIEDVPLLTDARAGPGAPRLERHRALTCRLKRACTGSLRSNAHALRRRSQWCCPTWMAAVALTGRAFLRRAEPAGEPARASPARLRGQTRCAGRRCRGASLEMVVGLLGILKSGAAYLPIDPATPAAWRKVIFDDARPLAVVTQPHLAYAVAGLGPDVAVMALAGPAEDPPGPESNPEPVNAPG